jgi:hydroxyethylthiazole kinase
VIGEALRRLRERRPLVHQLTNYVVMNETANATLAIGALPVMAHAREEVEQMASAAGALVLNIGTLSSPWVEAMLLAGRAANAAGVPVVLDPVGSGATDYRTETARWIAGEVELAVVRGNAAEIATLAGREAEIRGVESVGAESNAELARTAARALGTVAAVTGPVDHISDGDTVNAVANGHPLLATVTGTGCMSTAITGCFLAVASPLEAATAALAAFGVAGEDAAVEARGPGSFHVGLYDALAALDPDTLDGRARVTPA